MGIGIIGLLILLVIGIVVFVICNVKLKKDDQKKDYAAMDIKQLGGKVKKLNKGKLALVFPYDPVEKRKKEAILKIMQTTTQVSDEYGELYTVSSLVSEDYYFKQFTSKDGPYVAYAVFPVKSDEKLEEAQELEEASDEEREIEVDKFSD